MGVKNPKKCVFSIFLPRTFPTKKGIFVFPWVRRGVFGVFGGFGVKMRVLGSFRGFWGGVLGATICVSKTVVYEITC